MCSICLAELDFSKDHISATECGHLYHKGCLSSWFQTKHDCPECRKAVNITRTVDRVYANYREEDSVDYTGSSSETKDILKVVNEQFNNSVKLFLSRIVKLENENTELKGKLELSKKSAEKLKSANTVLKIELDICQTAVETLHRSKQVLDVKVDFLEKQLSGTEFFNKKLLTYINEVDSKNKELNKVINERSKMNPKLDSLQFSLKTAIKQITQLEILPNLSKDASFEENKSLINPDSSVSKQKQVFIVREGKTSTIIINDDETVHDLKMKINIKNNIPICRQRLVYAGKQLNNETIISEYKIQKESNIQLFIRNVRSPDVDDCNEE